MSVVFGSQEVREQLKQVRRWLHQRPELSLEEYQTTAFIREFLTKNGVEVLDYPLATGVLARVRGRRPGPCIALRADIDALPITEQTGLSFSSTVPLRMHACGHDFHTSALLGAALMLSELSESETSFAGDVLLVFQPAEEVGCGAKLMMDTGVFKDLNVRAIFGEHNQPMLDTGKIGVAAGPLMASVDEFKVVVRGVGGHAAIPERTCDPIAISSQIVSGLQQIVSRSVSPFDSVVVTVGQFHAGTARNVIPETAVFEGTVRCLQPNMRSVVEDRFRKYVEQTAVAFGASAEVEYMRVLPGVVNDGEMAALVRDAATRVVGESAVAVASPSTAGEDFSIYQEQLPGCFFWVGTQRTEGVSHGWHHPKFDVDEDMLPITSRVFVEIALTYFDRFQG